LLFKAKLNKKIQKSSTIYKCAKTILNTTKACKYI